MSDELQEAISKARKLLGNNRHAAMATVNEDGSPHNTPFFFMYEPDLSLMYWGSHLESQHSINIARSGEAFLVLYDSVRPKQGGLYLSLQNCHELSGDELNQALTVHNKFRTKEGKQPLKLEYYTAPSPQRMYSGKPVKCWILMSQNDENGLRIKDYRQEIEPSLLVKK